ncbi:hypothetical protein PUNSTDRAFT_122882 [Punctularia strigosozonata HHB-11173 SS5]|uniref:GATA-type domain-containing protein n=1 Tax=Punctularia strigosozonata (strain HHB-11173) TaxID=741275 RepID=R7S1N7_PUNST|nr:uncharacterized protein PUNSTDRAFT_122882 [Punctularia strigosozonata HHB-11173 SS5]EIN04295.1 hypothetical protein PUNSTDRAFT_122882 [Punctularia strigosozonata HHB-11173 SS5]
MFVLSLDETLSISSLLRTVHSDSPVVQRVQSRMDAFLFNAVVGGNPVSLANATDDTTNPPSWLAGSTSARGMVAAAAESYSTWHSPIPKAAVKIEPEDWVWPSHSYDTQQPTERVTTTRSGPPEAPTEASSTESCSSSTGTSSEDASVPTFDFEPYHRVLYPAPNGLPASDDDADGSSPSAPAEPELARPWNRWPASPNDARAHDYQPAARPGRGSHGQVERVCFNCDARSSAAWRRSSLTPGKSLCNKCGLYERTHMKPRPHEAITRRDRDRERIRHRLSASPSTPYDLPHAAQTVPSQMRTELLPPAPGGMRARTRRESDAAEREVETDGEARRPRATVRGAARVPPMHENVKEPASATR